MRQFIRKLRHWKQQWDRDAEFVWRRYTRYAGKDCMPGDTIPDILKDNPTKLRRFWESQRIELALFEDPNVATGQAEATLVGSGVLLSSYKINDETVMLGDIVCFAHENSDMSVAEWNSLDDYDREVLIVEALLGLHEEDSYAWLDGTGEET